MKNVEMTSGIPLIIPERQREQIAELLFYGQNAALVSELAARTAAAIRAKEKADQGWHQIVEDIDLALKKASAKKESATQTQVLTLA